MSEYQFYEFQAIDRSLTDRQMQELRAISTRAAITRTRFSNYYTFGDLKANPRDLLVRYFDASLFFANWRYVELAFRYPKSAVDVKALRRYVAGQSLDVRSKGTDVVVAMSVERDDFDAEDDGQGWLSSLIALRTDIANGDERVLYLAWLLVFSRARSTMAQPEMCIQVSDRSRRRGLSEICIQISDSVISLQTGARRLLAPERSTNFARMLWSCSSSNSLADRRA